MNLRERFFSNYMLRVVLRDGDTVSNYPNREGGFTPFFAYFIGNYKDDFYLYFPKQPKAIAYYNEIFNKLSCYFANDAVQFLRFHLDLYPDKKAFLDFLFYELKHRDNQLQIPSRLYRASRKRRSSIYQMCLVWVSKQLADMQEQNKQTIYASFLRNDLNVIINNHLAENGIQRAGAGDVNELRETLTGEVDKIVERIEEKTTAMLAAMRNDYLIGGIETPHPRAVELFILLILALKDFQADKNNMFNSFAEIDIAKILRLHFEYFKRKETELDTIRKKYINLVSVRYHSDAFNKNSVAIDELLSKLLV